MTGKLPTRDKALGPVLLFSLSRLVRYVNQFVSQWNETKGNIGSDTPVNGETARKLRNESTGLDPS